MQIWSRRERRRRSSNNKDLVHDTQKLMASFVHPTVEFLRTLRGLSSKRQAFINRPGAFFFSSFHRPGENTHTTHMAGAQEKLQISTGHYARSEIAKPSNIEAIPDGPDRQLALNVFAAIIDYANQRGYALSINEVDGFDRSPDRGEYWVLCAYGITKVKDELRRFIEAAVGKENVLKTYVETTKISRSMDLSRARRSAPYIVHIPKTLVRIGAVEPRPISVDSLLSPGSADSGVMHQHRANPPANHASSSSALFQPSSSSSSAHSLFPSRPYQPPLHGSVQPYLASSSSAAQPSPAYAHPAITHHPAPQALTSSERIPSATRRAAASRSDALLRGGSPLHASEHRAPVSHKRRAKKKKRQLKPRVVKQLDSYSNDRDCDPYRAHASPETTNGHSDRSGGYRPGFFGRLFDTLLGVDSNKVET